MVVALEEPEAILKQILTLDLKQSDVDVCLASNWQGDDTPSFRRIRLANDMQDTFREAINIALEKYKKGVPTNDIELTEFSADTEKPDQEIEYLNFLPFDSIKEQIKPLEAPLAMAQFEHKENLFVNGMRFYVIRIQPPQGPAIYFYRRYSHTQELSESQMFGMRFLESNIYSRVTEPIFLFDRHVDCLSVEEHMFILQKNNFFFIFNFTELEKVARQTLDKIELKDFIHNYKRFKSDCLQDKNKILKLKNISMRAYLDTLTVDDLEKNIKQYTLPILVQFVGGKKKIVYDTRDRWSILKLLDDSWTDSGMTGESYYVKSKRGIGKRKK